MGWNKVIYLINEKRPYQNKLKSLKQGHMVVNQPEFADRVKEQLNEGVDLNIIPTYNSEFRLGHSSREKVQEIVFFAENAANNDVKQIIFKLYEYIKKDFKIKSLEYLLIVWRRLI